MEELEHLQIKQQVLHIQIQLVNLEYQMLNQVDQVIHLLVGIQLQMVVQK